MSRPPAVSAKLDARLAENRSNSEKIRRESLKTTAEPVGSGG
jgi:hypothetical protein